MNKWFATTTLLPLLALSLLCGCATGPADKPDRLASAPNLEKIGTPPDYLAETLHAAGGLTAWQNATHLTLDAVVTFYQPDGSFYLTEQRYELFPWSYAIRITGTEPAGSYLWQWQRGSFQVLQGPSQLRHITEVVESPCFAEAVATFLAAPAVLLDPQQQLSRLGRAIRLHGKWFDPIRRDVPPQPDQKPTVSPAVFYQSRDSALIQIVWLSCNQPRKFLAIHGFNYQQLENPPIMLPRKLELLQTDGKGTSRRRLAIIELRPAEK